MPATINQFSFWRSLICHHQMQTLNLFDRMCWFSPASLHGFLEERCIYQLDQKEAYCCLNRYYLQTFLAIWITNAVTSSKHSRLGYQSSTTIGFCFCRFHADEQGEKSNIRFSVQESSRNISWRNGRMKAQRLAFTISMRSYNIEQPLYSAREKRRHSGGVYDKIVKF